MDKSWDEIERVDGMEGIRAWVETKALPQLASVETEPSGEKSAAKGMATVSSVAMGLFALVFFSTMLLLPENFLGILLRFVLFPFLFFGAIIATLWLFQERITAYALRAHGRLKLRSQVLSGIASHLGLTYVTSPGKPPVAIKWMARQGWVPPDLRHVLEEIAGKEEMVAPVEALRDSGLIGGNTIVIGSEEQKAQYLEQLSANLNFEDGFHGVRKGIAFDILEWKENQDEAEDIYHLIIVLKAPRTKQGVIQLKSRKASWWRTPGEKPMQKVVVGPDEFRSAYDVRADDQVEAHALFDPAVVARMIDITHGDVFRAHAMGDTLVFDVAGENRFAVLDAATGAWSEETVRQGLSDLAEALALVDALAEAFRVRRTAGEA